MSQPRTLDVSALPTDAIGPRGLIWWGAMLLILIEGTMMGLVLVSYFYLRGNFQLWPPSGIGDPSFRLAVWQMVLLVASGAPMLLVARAAKQENLRRARVGLILGTLLGIGLLVLRAFELKLLPFRWDDHAYGSLFWMAIGLHTTHVLTGLIENGVLIALLFLGPVERKHFDDLEASALLWYFVVLEWVPAFAVLYLEPIFLAR